MDIGQPKQSSNLEFLFNNTRDVIWSIDRELKLVCSNRAFNQFIERVVGHTPVPGEDVQYAEFGEETLAFWKIQYARVLAGEQFTIELVDERSENPFNEVTFNPIPNEKGEIIGAGCFSRDVSAFKLKEIELEKAHEDIKHSEERYRTLIQNSSDIVLLADENGIRTYVSPAIKPILGYEPEELIGQPVFDHVHPDDLQALYEIYAQAVSDPLNPVPTYVRFMHKNGSWRHLHITGSNQLSNPAIGAMVGNIRDVTDLVEAEATAKKNENYFRSLTENFPNGAMTVLGLDFKMRYVAGEDFKIFQLDPKSLTGLYYPGYYGAENVAFLEDKLNQILKGKSINYELPYEGYHYLVSGQPLYDENGNIQEIILLAQNITQLKRVSDALRDSEEKFRMLSEHSPVGIFQVAPNGYCTWMNERMCEISGFELSEGLGFGYTNFFHPDDKERIQSTWLEYAKRNEPTPILTYRILTKDRQLRWAYTQSAPLRDNHGNVVAYVGTIEDISDLKHYQDELLASRDHQEKILNSIPDGVVFLDNEWTITYANDNAEKILDLPRRDMLGWNMWERFPGSVGTGFYKNYLQSKADRKPFSLVDFYAPLNMWLEVNGTPTTDGFLVYFRNITENKELEYHLDRIYKMSPTMLGIVDATLHFTNFNPALPKLLGFTDAELSAKPFYEFMCAEDRQGSKKLVEQTMVTGGYAKTIENRYITKDGGYKWISWTVYGQPERHLLYFVAHDITEQKQEEKYLRMLQSVVTNTKDAVLITEADEINSPGPRIVYVNDAFTQITGYTAAEAIGQTPRMLQGIDTDVKELQKLKKAMLALEPCTIEVINYHKNGTPYWMNIMVKPVLDTTGKATHFISIQRDVTELKKSDHKLKMFAKQQENLAMLGFALVSLDDLETIYRTCISTLMLTIEVEMVIIALCDAQTGKVLQANCVGIPDGDCHDLDTHEDTHPGLCMKIGTEVVVSDYENHARVKPTGALKRAGAKSGVTVPLHGDVGVHGILGIFCNKTRDYTPDEVNYVKAVANMLSSAIKRLEATDKLNQSEKKYRLVFEENPLPLWIFDADTLDYIDVNEAAIQHYGYSREEFLKMKISDIRPKGDTKKLIDSVKLNSKGTLGLTQWSHVKKNGELIEVEISSNPISIDGKDYRLTLANDITVRKQLEAERERYQEQLENIVQQRTAQLQESNHELEAFNYTVSHDLRTPIRAIQMFVTLLDRECITAENCLEYTKNIRACTDEMTTLINDLLEFSKLRRQELSLVDISMENLSKEISQYLLSMETRKDINIKIGKLAATKGDATLMKSVWQNLISNAIKYSKRDNPININITSKKQHGMVEYCVADNGIGFDMKYADKLFKPFSRLHSGNEYKGTGAGLAIVDRIVSRHGGTVRVESVIGEGSKFYFILPINK